MSQGALLSDDTTDAPRPSAWAGASLARRALALAAVLFGIGIAGFTVTAVMRLHVVLPILDAWATVDDWRMWRAGVYGLDELVRQHNEHRLLVPRLFFLVDEGLFGMSDWDLLAETMLLQAMTAAALLWLGAQLLRDRVRLVALGGLVVGVLFSLSQEQNFASGFQIQFVGVFTAAVLAAMAFATGLARLGARGLAGTSRRGGWAYLALASFGCFVATYTMANGVLAAVALLGLAVLVRAPGRVVAATLLVAVILAASFFHGYENGTLGRPLREALADPLPYVDYGLAFLGNPLGPHQPAAQAFGALGLAGFAFAAVRLASGRERRPAAAALLAVMLFVLLSAAATAYGRILAGTDQAFETRYVTPAAVFWCALIVYLAGSLPRRPGPGFNLAAGVILAATAVLVGGAVAGERAGFLEMRQEAVSIRRFRDSLWSGLFDLEAAAYENNETADLLRFVPILKHEHLSLFAGPESEARGRPIAEVAPLAPPMTCDGSVTARADPALGPGGVRLAGEVVTHESAPTRILTAGPEERVSGFGSFDKPLFHPHRFAAYATAAPGESVSAYALLADGRLCRIGAAIVEPAAAGAS